MIDEIEKSFRNVIEAVKGLVWQKIGKVCKEIMIRWDYQVYPEKKLGHQEHLSLYTPPETAKIMCEPIFTEDK